MNTTLTFRDLSPVDAAVDSADHEWLERVAAVDPRAYRLGFGEDERDADEWAPLVERRNDGRWWAGRFIGFLQLDGRRLVVEPRLGLEVVERWLDQAFGIVAPPASAEHGQSEAFIVRLLARLWSRSVDAGTRHGLPSLRLPKAHEGLFVRGTLDLHRTLRLMGAGQERVASTTHDRSLAHAATRAIVCAERLLAERLAASGEWRSERVRAVMPHLRSAVGYRPQLPTLSEVEGVRFTPITLPFRRTAILSHRIASHLGYSAREGTEAEGLLIDVAELWELFVLNCLQQAVEPGMRVEHGTTAERRDFLLRSRDHSAGLGRLKPDVLVMTGGDVLAVIDAKYKRLADTRERPRGVEREDLYQLAAYVSRYRPARFAALLYPDADDPGMSSAEALGPWHDGETAFMFRRVPTTVDTARPMLADLLSAASGS